MQDGGIKSFDGTAEKTDDGQGAQASFVTLEETNVVLLIDLGGVRAEQEDDRAVRVLRGQRQERGAPRASPPAVSSR